MTKIESQTPRLIAESLTAGMNYNSEIGEYIELSNPNRYDEFDLMDKKEPLETYKRKPQLVKSDSNFVKKRP